MFRSLAFALFLHVNLFFLVVFSCARTGGSVGSVSKQKVKLSLQKGQGGVRPANAEGRLVGSTNVVCFSGLTDAKQRPTILTLRSPVMCAGYVTLSRTQLKLAGQASGTL